MLTTRPPKPLTSLEVFVLRSEELEELQLTGDDLSTFRIKRVSLQVHPNQILPKIPRNELRTKQWESADRHPQPIVALTAWVEDHHESFLSACLPLSHLSFCALHAAVFGEEEKEVTQRSL
jgi:hypothetical protein